MGQRVRVTIIVCIAVLTTAIAEAQTDSAGKPRRKFVSVSLDWLYTQPLHFGEHPVADLVGTEVAKAQFKEYEYETRDGSTRIDVLEFKRPGHGFGVTVYPIGISVGPTLGIRASAEALPTIRIAFDGPGALDSYALTNARAYDVSAGLWVADHSPGWGLGTYAFFGAGVGRIRSDLADGSRYFGEGGGGVTSGPLGVELSIKFAWNQFDVPVEHQFLTVPFTIRGTVTF